MSKTTTCVVKLLTLFLISVLPMCIWNSAIPYEDLGQKTNQIIGLFLYCLYWSVYGANYFLYVFACNKFRQARKQFLSWITCQKIELPDRFKLYFARPTAQPVNGTCSVRKNSIPCRISSSDRSTGVNIACTDETKKKRSKDMPVLQLNSQMGSVTDDNNSLASFEMKCVTLPCSSSRQNVHIGPTEFKRKES